jgi:hypothetical protein
VERALTDIRRVLRPGGRSFIQMPNLFGIRCLYHQIRRGFREARQFEVRYWTPAELTRRFSALVGPATLSVDGFFSLNPQPAEAHLLPWRFRAIVRISETLRALSKILPPLAYVADSLYVDARKAG